jgi:MFS transporter, MHS family, proline/betaine transporter
MTLKDIKIITLSSVGGALEFFEFTIYALFAQYISFNFFPHQNASLALMATFGIYALGYLARPLGGVLFGHIGDKYGRKSAFTLAILLMAVATLLIGCLPSYQSIGMISPITLIVLRLIQGFSVGGEIAGATIFTAEHLPAHQRGLGIGIVFMGITLGNTLGGLVGFILTHFLNDSTMLAWGWRLPFLIGFILGLFSYFIRKNTIETPIFKEIENKKLLKKLPFISLIQNFYPRILIGIGLMAIPSTMISFSLYLPVYLAHFLNFKLQQSFLLNIISFITLSFLTAVFGYCADLVNQKILAMAGCAVMAIASYIAFHFFLKPDFTHILLFICLLMTAASVINGCYALMIAELFPANVGYSGMGASYSIGVAVFGGLGPVAFTFLTVALQTTQAPFYYLLFNILISAIAIYFYKTASVLEFKQTGSVSYLLPPS